MPRPAESTPGELHFSHSSGTAQRSPAPALPAVPAAETAPEGQGRLGGLFLAASPSKALRMGLGGSGLLPPQSRGCSARIVLPTPSSDCSVERGEQRESWHGGEQWENWHLPAVPPSSPPPIAPAAPHPAFAGLGPALGLHPGCGAGPSGRELAGPQVPKITTSIAAAQGIPASSQSSACPLPVAKRSRRGASPQTRPGASRPTASRCGWHPGRRRGIVGEYLLASFLHH